MGETIEGQGRFYLRLWKIALGGVLGGGTLAAILKYKLQVGDYFPVFPPTFPQLWAFLQAKPLEVILTTCLLYIFIVTTREGDSSFEILRNAFPEQNRPQRWENLPGYELTTGLITLAAVLFLLMGLFIDDIIIFLILFVIANILPIPNDYNFHKAIRQYFSDEIYAPPPAPAYPFSEFAKEIRSIVDTYIDKPHIVKHSALLIACMVALLLAVAQDKWGFRYGEILAYIVLLAAVITNEWVVGKWRSSRNSAFRAIKKRWDTRKIEIEDALRAKTRAAS